MVSPAITVEGIGKQYQLGLREQRHQTFRDAVVDMAAAPWRRLRHLSGRSGEDDTFWALKDISFDVPEGEVLGIIGHNGAGKSTLLKILSRITEPTEGRATIHGRVASLLEVGTGFHNELTGRENVYLNGAILGMSRREIDRKFDEIVDFAGVKKFLDTPIKRYSSGMKVRLAFAVAAHLDPEILIIDEVLAVGDQEFQNKCLGKMRDVTTSGRTVIFVSHNLGAIESLCERVVILEHGKVAHLSSVSDGIAHYLKSYKSKEPAAILPEQGGPLQLLDLSLSDRFGCQTDAINSGDDVSITFRYSCSAETLPRVCILFTIYNQLGVAVTNVDTRLTGGDAFGQLADTGVVSCHFPTLAVPAGNYRIALAIFAGGSKLAHSSDALRFNVAPSSESASGIMPEMRHCTYLVDHSWTHKRSHAEVQS